MARPTVPDPATRAQPAIEMVGVTKRFRKRTLQRGYTTVKTHLLRSALENVFTRKTRRGNFLTALDDIHLRVEEGTTLGVIGHNGSGKSTLLKVMTGIYKPDAGQIRIRGRVSALIELGAGFHPEFTGRENIFLNGLVLGLKKDYIERKFEEIVSFADLEDFIDDPVRTYSSGMYMRLGFSIAIHVDPDILIVDEVLAVGDEAFIHKCQERVADFKRRGKTIVVVTHDLGAIERWCDDVVLLDHGHMVERGGPRRVIDAYRRLVAESEERRLADEHRRVAELTQQEPSAEAVAVRMDEVGAASTASPDQSRWGTREVEIVDVRLVDPPAPNDTCTRAETRCRSRSATSHKDAAAGLRHRVVPARRRVLLRHQYPHRPRRSAAARSAKAWSGARSVAWSSWRGITLVDVAVHAEDGARTTTARGAGRSRSDPAPPTWVYTDRDTSSAG
ncbi:MAG: ABC transporter ATP-binding protein [Deltaproteobacteria bacterium]|nr:ABC transporter ATP-binding protein [Deltaproteobacteria bacterium]